METKVVDEKFIEGTHGHELFQVSQKVVIYDAEKNAFLLVRIADAESSFAKKYGVWDFPGGHVDVGETLNAALLREVSEEIGAVRVDDPKPIGVFLAEYVEKRVCTIGYVAALLESIDPTLSSEHNEYRWVTAQEVAEGNEYGPIIRQFVSNAAERLKEREYLNDTKRMYADFENYKRRQEERMKELSAMCVEGVALDMIPVLDNFRAAGAHVPEEEKTKAWMTGITYIGKQLEDALASHGLVAYEAKEGEMFDPYLHEAVSHDEQGGEDGKIVKALQPGYKMGTKVIRPAKVIVA